MYNGFTTKPFTMQDRGLHNLLIYIVIKKLINSFVTMLKDEGVEKKSNETNNRFHFTENRRLQ